jgi:hypothetical protein
MYYVDISKHRKLRKKLSSCSIMVIRKNTNDKLVFSKPCASCIHILKRLCIRNVYYSDRNGNMICERVRDMVSNHTCEMQKHMTTVN